MSVDKLTYHGSVAKDGVINLPRKMRAELATAFQGKEIVVTVERRRKKRSDALNRYYWGCGCRSSPRASRPPTAKPTAQRQCTRQ
jgi:hypothetical protein